MFYVIQNMIGKMLLKIVKMIADEYFPFQQHWEFTQCSLLLKPHSHLCYVNNVIMRKQAIKSLYKLLM